MPKSDNKHAINLYNSIEKHIGPAAADDFFVKLPLSTSANGCWRGLFFTLADFHLENPSGLMLFNKAQYTKSWKHIPTTKGVNVSRTLV